MEKAARENASAAAPTLNAQAVEVFVRSAWVFESFLSGQLRTHSVAVPLCDYFTASCIRAHFTLETTSSHAVLELWRVYEYPKREDETHRVNACCAERPLGRCEKVLDPVMAWSNWPHDLARTSSLVVQPTTLVHSSQVIPAPFLSGCSH